MGAEHIACNLRSLDTLKISENNIGSEGAEHIANNLRNLKTLYISTELDICQTETILDLKELRRLARISKASLI